MDRQKSQSSKYALNIPSERVTHRDIVEFVGRYLKGDLQTYKVSEEDPKHILNATDIVPLNRKMFLEWVSSMKATRTDFIVLFYTNDGCTLCEGLWPMYEQLMQILYWEDPRLRTKLKFGTLNMDYNELSYLETLGSLPVFYPVVRYFHGAT